MPWQNTRINESNPQNRARVLIPRRFSSRLSALFLKLCHQISGIDDAQARQDYASLLLHRLMFIYFLQHLGFLAGERDYLRRRYNAHRAGEGGFFRRVLSPLFTQAWCADFSLDTTGLWAQHTLTQRYPDLDVADAFFADAFALFDAYRWQGDDAQGQMDDVLTPDILGVLFQFDLRQEAMGSHYTPSEVTSFIAQNTIPLAFFRRARACCVPETAFEHWLWQTLTAEPWRFLYPALSHGYARTLPAEISAGIADVTRRTHWHQLAGPDYGLVGETWREVIARRARLDEILARLRQVDIPGELAQLLSWNIDLATLARAMLRSCPQPELLLACYQSVRQLSVLDPTCGSGAFLCAALPLLQELTLICLERMEAWCVEQTGQLSSTMLRTFQTCLAEAGMPEQRAYQSLRWIIEHALYGVDLNADAIESCRQRLYLKLLAALPVQQQPPPARSISQHIRVGNSLLGSLAPASGETRVHDSPGTSPSLQGFPWEQAFPILARRGGFDVILGNPPYVEYARVRSSYELEGYTTLETGNLYALTIERATQLLAPGGQCGMLVPASATCTHGYRSLQRLLFAQQTLHIASFSDQRGHLLTIPHPRLCIICYTKPMTDHASACRVFTTSYLKLGAEDHSSLFQHLNYTEVTSCARAGLIPRFGSPLEGEIYRKLLRQQQRLGAYRQRAGPHPIYFTRKLSWYVQVTPFIPRILDTQGQVRVPSELKSVAFSSRSHARIAFAALNSNLFYWLITTGSDGRNLNMREVLNLPLDLASIAPTLQQELLRLADELEADLLKHACMKTMRFQKQGSLTIQCLYPACSRPLIDEIDRMLARHLALHETELDFLLHYDEKYRRPTRV